jgi:hypothetical protein
MLAQGRGWNLLNTANICLIPKKQDASSPLDYRPISLMHSGAKILGKMMASRLAPELHGLISTCQSAFIKKRSIHDKFIFVRGVIKEVHSKKKPLLFMKLDFAKAFDSVHWGYLLEALSAFGFGPVWRRMTALLLSSASSRILLNGEPGPPILHRRRLRQGDPLAPMLFILALEPLQQILARATESGLLTPLANGAARMRSSFYADDVALFINPSTDQIASVFGILDIFGLISGLRINPGKCTIFPIICDSLDTVSMIGHSGCALGSLPCTYLGLPLGYRNPTRSECQIFIDKITAKLKPWHGKLMTRAGRLTQVNSVLTAVMTYFLSVFDPPKWLIKKIDRIRRSFLWCGEENASGGKCLVNWKIVCSPKSLGDSELKI